MKREQAINAIGSAKEPWDFLVIGGGATGLGVGVDAAARGYRTLVLEQADFAKGTSSRSTKLVHGGVRYLKQGNISLSWRRCENADCCAKTRRTWFTICRSSCRSTAGGRVRSTASE